MVERYGTTTVLARVSLLGPGKELAANNRLYMRRVWERKSYLIRIQLLTDTFGHSHSYSSFQLHNILCVTTMASRPFFLKPGVRPLTIMRRLRNLWGRLYENCSFGVSLPPPSYILFRSLSIFFLGNQKNYLQPG